MQVMCLRSLSPCLLRPSQQVASCGCLETATIFKSQLWEYSGTASMTHWVTNITLPKPQHPFSDMSTVSLPNFTGYIMPFMCKVLTQDLWTADVGLNDPIQPYNLLERWLSWEQDIPTLLHRKLPHSYTASCADTVTATRYVHIFCDAMRLWVCQLPAGSR